MAEREPRHPWRLDSNDRYREVVRTIISLSTASLAIPIFFLKNILSVPAGKPLLDILDWTVFASWILLFLSIVFGLVFYYASAKWIRLAWGQSAGFFGRSTNESTVETVLHISFWVSVLAFAIGLSLILWFIVTFAGDQSPTDVRILVG